MPPLKVLDIGEVGLRPSETGVEATARAAARGGALFREASEAVQSIGRDAAGAISAVGETALKYEDHREISHGSAVGTQLASQIDADWNVIQKGGTLSDGTVVQKADPNDPSVRAKFLEEAEQKLDSFKSNFNTEKSQAFADQFVNNLRNHLSVKTAADMANNAGIAARQNVERTINNLGSMVANDPSSLDFALTQYRHAVSAQIDSSPTLDATKAEAIKADLKGEKALVKAAILAKLTNDPNTDLSKIQQRYGEFIEPGEMTLFRRTAQAQAKADFIQTKQVEAYQRQQQEHAADQALSKVITDNMTADPVTGRVSIKPQAVQQTLDIARKYPEAGPASARTMLDWIENQQKKEDNVTDPGVRNKLLDGMLSPNSPTTLNNVLQAQIDGKLSNRDATILREMLQSNKSGATTDPVFTGVMGAVKQEIEQSLNGPQNYGKFFYGFVRDYQRQAAAGTLPPNALDLKDEGSLISQYFKQYAPTLTEKMQYHILKNVGANPADVDPEALSATFAKKPPAPSAASPVAPKRISNKAEYDALPPGARYISPRDGATYEKPRLPN